MTQPYDSRADTGEHIQRVRDLLRIAESNLLDRALLHDASKLRSPEKEMFDAYTPKLRAMTYGSDEYKATLAEMQATALAHHYAHNDHHPEHFFNGINGMSLLSLMEMLCDWKAATERHADGDLAKSLKINQARFGISDQLHKILINTALEMGWIE